MSAKEQEFNIVVWDAAGVEDIDQLIEALTTHGHLIDAPHPHRKDRNQHSYHTPMHRAAEKGNVLAIETLVRFGSKAIDASIDDDQTPLHLAAAKGHAGAIEALIRLGSKAIQPPTDEDEEVWTPLHAAAKKGHVGAIEALLRCTKDLSQIVDGEGYSAMDYAAEKGHVDAIEALARFDPQTVNSNRGWFTPMHYAARKGHVRAIERLFRLGSEDIDAITDDYSETPMHEAASCGHANVIETLVRFGSTESLHTNNNTWGSPLQAALGEGKMEVAKFLKALYANPMLPAEEEDELDSEDIEVTEDEVVKLRYRAYFGHSLAQRLLIQLDRLPWIMAAQGERKLWETLSGGDVDQFVDTLTNNRHLIACKDWRKSRRTLMHYAAKKGNVQAIEALVRFGSDALDTPDLLRRTPLHYAVENGHAPVIEALVRLGSKLDVRQSFCEEALFQGHLSCVQLLKALGVADLSANVELTEDERSEMRYRVYFAHLLAKRLLFELDRLSFSHARTLLVQKKEELA